MDRNTENKIGSFFVLLLASIVLLIFSTRLSYLRNSISYMYSGMSQTSMRSGQELHRYLTLYSDLVSIKSENEKLKAENSRLTSDLINMSFILEENQQLKSIKSIKYTTGKLLKANMFVSSVTPENAYINRGEKDGVERGDVVQYGLIYVGNIESVDGSSAMVKLPYSKASFLRVSILKPFVWQGKTAQELSKNVASLFRSTAVAIGKGDSIVIENISVDKGVADGDIVVVNDEKVGKYLVLGRIKGISSDPAASSVSADVETILNYEDINTFFIEIE
ncbi:MAG: hypothetical protein UT34_C0001G0409 [candidate division WS6 bacterium GW2011_GWF2_39_15]|uniref:Cell shape-determining protein MreC n=1 Tax=candidate division WS6 bacterium GW2011_GWF2_39_15 TaxID=1619100 RepID=A0A0G0MQR1_9BACT|nr:MAG: hypothetical protein UT34_C0001G0409 [candidate division WS6 bacterium GW2011_GWF2_39_15]